MSADGTTPLTVCIPAYEMGGLGQAFLRHSLDVLSGQTLTDFDVVVSDDSADGRIEAVCTEYSGRLRLAYVKNPEPPGLATNANNAMRHATGGIIKFLCQDDFLFRPTSLQAIVDHFDLEHDTWLVTGCEHTRDGETFHLLHYPWYSDDIVLGRNTIGAPSVLSVRNAAPLQFDPNLSWLVDCDYYRRYHDLAGEPKILNDVGVAIRLGDHQVTSARITPALREREARYLAEKFALR
jgi:glycosyltransferase involved in cell wall biosynthesis